MCLQGFTIEFVNKSCITLMKNSKKASTKELNALKKAVSIAGNQSALAASLGVHQQSISYWLLNNVRVPGEYVIPIERASYGQVKRHELRPDLYPIEDYRFLNERRVNEHSLS